MMVMNFRRFLRVFLVLVLMAITMVGCGNSVPLAMELVPQDASLIAQIQVSRLVNDQDIIEAYNKAEKEPGQPETVEEALDEIAEETGLDLHDFTRVTLFADVAKFKGAEYLGLIVEGTFDEGHFIENMKERTEEEFTAREYKGYTLHTGQEDEFALAFLEEKVLLFGTIKAVEHAIDVRRGDRERIKGVILETYNRLGDAAIRFAFGVPEEARERLTEGSPGGVPISLEPFADTDVVGFALDKESENVIIRIDTHFLNLSSAQDAKDTVGGAITLFKGILQDPEAQEFLGKVRVASDDLWMTITLKATISEMEKLYGKSW